MIRALVRTCGELLVTTGAMVLLFLAWQLMWTDVVADRAQARTTDALLEQWDAAGAGPVPGSDDATPAPDGDDEGGSVAVDERGAAADDVVAALPSQALAVLRVPAFGDDYARPVLAGTDDRVLQDGIGHYDGAALPGEVGNFAVAGHRTTYGAPFNPVEELEVGDAVVAETPESFHVYRVVTTEIVGPADVRVIAPVPSRPGETPTEAWLTMTTCHPMFSARERYVVHALLESTTPRADGPPAALQAAGAG